MASRSFLLLVVTVLVKMLQAESRNLKTCETARYKNAQTDRITYMSLHEVQQRPLAGARLVVGFWNCSVKNFDVSLLYVNVMDELADFYNFSYSKVGLCDGGFQKAAVDIRAGRMDMICGVHLYVERAKELKFLATIEEDYFTFLIRMPLRSIHSNMTLLGPFSLTSSLLICACAIAVAIVLTLYSWYDETGRRGRGVSSASCDRNHVITHLDHSFTYVFGSFFSQVGTFRTSSPWLRIMEGCWWLFVIIIVAIYSGMWISVLSVDTMAVFPFENLEEATKSFITPVVWRNFASERILQSENLDSHFGKLWQKVKKDPSAIIDSLDEALRLVLTGKYAFLTSVSNAKRYIISDYVESGRCRLAMAPVEVVPTSVSCAMLQTSPYLEQLDRGVSFLRQDGLIRKWNKESLVPLRSLCGGGGSEVAVSAQTIDVGKMYTMFEVPFWGTLAALFILCAEKLIHFASVLLNRTVEQLPRP